MSEERDAMLRTADALVDGMNELSGEIKTLRTYSTRTRNMLWGLMVVAVLAVATVIVLVITAINADDALDEALAATSLAEENKRNAVVTCKAGNEARAVNRQLWSYVLGLAEENRDEPLTPDEEKRIDQFRSYIKTKFADRDCTPAR